MDVSGIDMPEAMRRTPLVLANGRSADMQMGVFLNDTNCRGPCALQRTERLDDHRRTVAFPRRCDDSSKILRKCW
jgi:hypothetical protein